MNQSVAPTPSLRQASGGQDKDPSVILLIRVGDCVTRVGASVPGARAASNILELNFSGVPVFRYETGRALKLIVAQSRWNNLN